MRFISIQEVNPYSSIDTVTAWKKSCFILSERSDFHMIDNLLYNVFPKHILTMLFVDEIFLPRYVNGSIYIISEWTILFLILLNF